VSFGHYDWTTGCLRPMSPAPCVNTKPNTSHGLALPYRVQPSVEPQPASLALTKDQQTAPSMRFEPLQRLPSQGSGLQSNGFTSPEPERLQVFSTSRRLLPPRDCWPCFMPDPLMGFALQSVAPPAQPCAVPDAATLMTFATPNRPPRISRIVAQPKSRALNPRTQVRRRD